MNPKHLFFSLFLLTGCASVPDTYYTLHPDIITTVQHQGRPTALRYTQLPPYYDNEFLAYYGKNNRIIIDKAHHWIFPFSDNLRDVLRQKIAATTGNSRIYTYPIGNNIHPSVIIDLQIRELIADSSTNTYRISAQWQLNTPNNPNPDNHEYHKTYPLADAGPESITRATQKAVNALAQAIAKSL